MHRSRPTAPAAAALSFAALTAAMVSASAPAQPTNPAVALPIVPVQFVERPGELEFTGRLLLRPRTVAERVAVDGPAAVETFAARDAAARARLVPNLDSHERGPDRYVVRVPAGKTESSYAAELMATGDYAWVSPDWLCFPIATPNDPRFNDQWHHQVMESEAAWDVTIGDTELISAFVDTGVDLDHEDLVDRLVPGYNSVDRIAQAAGGDVSDVNGHGTRVGGCISATGDNGLGVAGMAWNLKLMPIKTSNSPGGGAALSNILNGAEWSIGRGARITSASYSGIQSPAIQDSGAFIKSQGGLFLYAANNANQNHSGFDWEDVIVVGATDQSDNKAGFSSYGRGVDMFAPGVGVWTTSNGGGYASPNGTSFATPVANGVLALIWSIAPDLTPQQVETVLYLSCDDLGAPGEDDFFGWGRANARRAVEFAQLASLPQPPVAGSDTGETIAGFDLDLDVLANDVDLNLDVLSLESVDAGSALGGTATIVSGAGPEGRDIVRYTPPADVFGVDTFTYVVADQDGTDTGTVTIDVIDPSTLRMPENPTSTAPGVEVAYYELVSPEVLPDFDTLTPYAGDVVSAIAFQSTGGDFISSGRADDVGAVFTAFVDVPTVGNWTFSVESDDGSKLYIGDTLIVDNDGLHGMEDRSGDIGLQPGRHAIRVEFFERGGGAGVLVRFEGPGTPRQLIPASQWSFEIPDPCPIDLDDSGQVDFGDLLTLLGTWGPCPSGAACPADFDGNGDVDLDDLLTLLVEWGPCPG